MAKNKTGENIIPCAYDDASSFLNGFVEVEFHGKYGYINKGDVQYWEH